VFSVLPPEQVEKVAGTPYCGVSPEFNLRDRAQALNFPGNGEAVIQT
jgi:hypothetical protein